MTVCTAAVAIAEDSTSLSPSLCVFVKQWLFHVRFAIRNPVNPLKLSLVEHDSQDALWKVTGCAGISWLTNFV